jgi:TPR repeat protein
LPGRIPRTDTVQLKPGENYTWSPRLAPLQQQQAVASKPGAATQRSPSEPALKRGNPDEASCQQTMTAGAWGGAYASCARAARAGSAGAARDVGLLFQRGTGVGRSDDSAAHWFGEAARAGDGESMYQLALYYERGRGVKKDQAVALDWYTRSANTGLANAEYALGQVYEKGHLGMAKDKAKALVWYRKAAAQGHKDAAARVHDLAQ